MPSDRESISSKNFFQQLVAEGLVDETVTEVEATNLIAKIISLLSIGKLGLVRRDFKYTSELNPNDVFMNTRIAQKTGKVVSLQDVMLNRLELANALNHGKTRYNIRNRSKNN